MVEKGMYQISVGEIVSSIKSVLVKCAPWQKVSSQQRISVSGLAGVRGVGQK